MHDSFYGSALGNEDVPLNLVVSAWLRRFVYSTHLSIETRVSCPFLYIFSFAIEHGIQSIVQKQELQASGTLAKLSRKKLSSCINGEGGGCCNPSKVFTEIFSVTVATNVFRLFFT